MSIHRKALLIDFDGTIHPYNRTYKDYDHNNIKDWDPPTQETKDALEVYIDSFDVFVFSTRCSTGLGMQLIWEWFEYHGFSNSFLKNIQFTHEKIMHHLIIDDRGFHFVGKWPTVGEIEAFKPHNKRNM